MTAKKWLISFVLTALALIVVLAAFNILTDPFGIFGDPIMGWWAYNETNNPRTSKITYLEEHFDEYDSYIVGCSSTSSFPVETLNAYYNRTENVSFYNMIMYGADMLDCEQTIAYLLENDDVKHIWLNVYLDNGMEYDTESNPYTHAMHTKVDGSNPIAFYSRYLFLNPEYGTAKLKSATSNTWLSQWYDIFDEQTGAYDKRRRDIEPISDMADYLNAYPVFANYPSGSGYLLPKVQACVDSVAKIAAMCEEAGAVLTVVTAPVYADYLAYFDYSDIAAFYCALAEVTDFWNFSISSVSFEPRYFYDSTHFRNDIGDMALARIFGDTNTYIPADFGEYVTAENAGEIFAAKSSACALPESEIEAKVPVLMYHHIDENINDVTVTPETFEQHMNALTEAGYTTVSMSEIYEYVTGNGTLTEKPILITFDDGYASNYEIAYPILEERGMKAAIFTIGSSVGKSTYKDTDHAIIPHCTAAELREMAQSGVFEIGSHTYDLHQSEEYEPGTARQDLGRLETESEREYLNTLREDCLRSFADLQQITGENHLLTFAYPRGVWIDEAAAVLREMGVQMTFSTQAGVHTFVRGLEQSMYAVKRFNIGGDMTTEELLALIEN